MTQKILLLLSLCSCTPPTNIDQLSQAAAAEPGTGNVVPGWNFMGKRWTNGVVPYVLDRDNTLTFPATGVRRFAEPRSPDRPPGNGVPQCHRRAEPAHASALRGVLPGQPASAALSNLPGVPLVGRDDHPRNADRDLQQHDRL
jgi:hypothetical protein